jgi:hypothetical protein
VEPAQELALLAELVTHEHGEWGESRWKTYEDENAGIMVFFATTREPPADCVVEIGWKEGARRRVGGPFGKLETVDESGEVIVLRWRDGAADSYDEKLGPVVIKHLRDKLMPGTPLLRLIDRVKATNKPALRPMVRCMSCSGSGVIYVPDIAIGVKTKSCGACYGLGQVPS